VNLSFLEYITKFNAADMKLIDKLVRQLDEGDNLTTVMAQHFLGTMNVFRAGEALVLTQTVSVKGHSQLVVYGLIGRGIISNAEKICDDLRTIAKTFGCSSVGGNVSRPGLARLYQTLGAKPVYTFYELELG